MKTLSELEKLVDKEENWAEHFECEQPIYKSAIIDSKGLSQKTIQKLLTRWSESVSTPAVKEGINTYSEAVMQKQSYKTIIETDTHYVVLNSWNHTNGKSKALALGIGIIKKQAEI